LRQYKPIEASGVAAAMVEVAKQNRDGIHIYESEQILKIALDAVGKG
jgi:hydrogenase maturation factor